MYVYTCSCIRWGMHPHTSYILHYSVTLKLMIVVRPGLHLAFQQLGIRITRCLLGHSGDRASSCYGDLRGAPRHWLWFLLSIFIVGPLCGMLGAKHLNRGLVSVTGRGR